MAVELRKDPIDLGIVVKDSAAALGFYRDLLGFEHVGDNPMPGALTGTMHRLLCGTTMIKLVDEATLRPGVSMTMVADPDGNWVEFVDDRS